VRVLLAGASGFLGTSLTRRLAEDDHTTIRLVRSPARRPDELHWDPQAGQLPAAALDGVDAVVNLAGASIGHWPWTSSYRRQLLESRTRTTRTLAKAVAERQTPPVLVNGSAVGLYGRDRGDEELPEESGRGDGFLADVVEQWEAETEPARVAGARVALIRTAPVLDGSGGVLKIIKLPFQLGVGGRLGSGRQWFPSISLDDWLEVIVRVLTDEQLSGAYNAAAPVPATNAELTRLLGELLNRPTVVPVPAFVLRTVLGEVSDQLLGSLKVRPKRLLDAGFEFRHPDLASQLRAALSTASTESA
jgi:uncharacterized protein (TIGR01777 family)